MHFFNRCTSSADARSSVCTSHFCGVRGYSCAKKQLHNSLAWRERDEEDSRLISLLKRPKIFGHWSSIECFMKRVMSFELYSLGYIRTEREDVRDLPF